MKRILAFMLALALLFALCACGDAQQSEPKEQTGENEETVDPKEGNEETTDPAEPVETPEPTPEIPLTYAQEHDFQFSMKMEAESQASQYVTDGDGTLTPATCDARTILTSVERTEPDEDGYVTYTFIFQIFLYCDGVYTYASDNHDFIYNVHYEDPILMDMYTGTVFPYRELYGNDSFSYSAEIEWEGKSYTVEYSASSELDTSRVKFIEIDGGKYITSSNRPVITDVVRTVRVPAEYDGLCIAWYHGGTALYTQEKPYEEIPDPYLFCDGKTFTQLSDYHFTRVDAAVTALNGNVETPPHSEFAKQVGGEEYEADIEALKKGREDYPIFVYGIDQTGNYKDFESFPDIPKNSPFLDYGGRLIFNIREEFYNNRDVNEISDFLLENKSADLQIALVVFDEFGQLIGSSGLVGPNEYITHFPLDKPGHVEIRMRYYMSRIRQYGYDENVPPDEYSFYTVTGYIPEYCIMIFIYDMNGDLVAANSLDNYNASFLN